MLVSGIQQNDLVIHKHIHIYILFYILFSIMVYYRLSNIVTGVLK